jgi:uncharacterized RDD family membrane protein YckC
VSPAAPPPVSVARPAAEAARRARKEAADAMLGRAIQRDVVEIVTPEGVPIRFTIGSAGDRAAALIADVMMITFGLLALLLLMAATGLRMDGWTSAVLFLAIFALRHGWFAVQEARPRGATFGKRRLGLRVIDRTGAPLTTEAVLVRNLTREVELWIPIMVINSPDALFPGAPGWVRLGAVVWILVFLFFPLTNRLRLRIGDLLAGTMVVVAPQATLLGDVVRRAEEGRTPAPVAGSGPAAPAPAPAAPVHAFTDAQLDVYGIYELQVLEDVLRRGSVPGPGRDAMDAVADRIRKKIGWTGPKTPAKSFLAEFYAALRARLERRMLFGKRKEDKWST